MSEPLNDKKIQALATYASLARAVHSLDDLLERQCDTFGLTSSQFRVLEHLRLYGPVATGELASSVIFGDNTISVVTRNLESAGLVVRRADKTDGRKAIIHLTPEGKKMVERILPKRGKVLRAKMCVLGKREQENLDRMCRKLAEGDAVKFALEMTMDDGDEVD